MFLTSAAYAKEVNFSFEHFLTQKDSIQGNLASKEWKKFKYFEQQLQSSTLSQKDQVRQLTGYARDSLQILRVKLVAIKVLNERN